MGCLHSHLIWVNGESPVRLRVEKTPDQGLIAGRTLFDSGQEKRERAGFSAEEPQQILYNTTCSSPTDKRS